VILRPLRREYVEERFVLEPVQHAVVRTEVPGLISQVLADEGQRVEAGAPIAKLSDLPLVAQEQEAAAQYQMASARATQAELSYANYAAAEQHRLALASAFRAAREKESKLEVRAPISGVVITPRVRDLEGTYAAAGTQIAEIADVSTLRARVYVPEVEMEKLGTLSGNSMRMESEWSARHGQVVAISDSSQRLAAGLQPPPKYAGMRTPAFFTVDIVLANSDGRLRDGMTGIARIYGRRRSYLASVLQPFVDAVARRLW